jgi:RNA polymerase sigma-70 factor, ECF subfamily
MKVSELRRSNEEMSRALANRAEVTCTHRVTPLLSRCVSGDSEAWRELHREFFPVAAAFLRKLGVRDDEMEDACQDVFLQLHRCLPGFRGEADFKTWLYRLCATEAGKLRRRGRVLGLLQSLLHRQFNVPPSVGQELDAGSARRRVEAGLAALKPAERTVFVLYEMEGLSGEEIARIVKAPLATIWRRLHYARQSFRECIEAGGRNP